MSEKTNPNIPNPAPDSGTPAGTNAETHPGATLPETPQAPPPAPPPPLHEHPDFKARMEQAQRSGQRALLTAMGFADLEDPDRLQAAIEQMGSLVAYARERQQAEMTAEERHAAELKTLQAERDAALSERDTARADAEAIRAEFVAYKDSLQRNAAIQAVAKRQGAHRPEDVTVWAEKNRPDELAAVLADGKIDEAAATAIVDACAADRPEWFTPRGPGAPSHSGGRPPTAPQLDDTKKEQARRIAQRGMR